MSSETVTRHGAEVAETDWQAGVVGGLAGSLAMGVLVLITNMPTAAVAIPSLYTLAPPPNPLLGVLIHLFHGAVLGLVFAGAAGVLGVDSPTRVVALGLAWGTVTWVLLAALLMPLWLSAVGSPVSPPFPNFAIPSLVWHAVYGVVLGGVFVAVRDRI